MFMEVEIKSDFAAIQRNNLNVKVYFTVREGKLREN